MNKTLSIIILATIILVVVYYLFNTVSTIIADDDNFNADNIDFINVDLSKLSPQTLSKIKNVCASPTGKAWFEKTYQVKCSNFV